MSQWVTLHRTFEHDGVRIHAAFVLHVASGTFEPRRPASDSPPSRSSAASATPYHGKRPRDWTERAACGGLPFSGGGVFPEFSRNFPGGTFRVEHSTNSLIP